MKTDLPFDIIELVRRPMPVPDTAPLRETTFRADAWLPEDLDLFRALFHADESIEAIKTSTGRSIDAIRSKVAELGLRRNSRRPWTALEDEELVRRYGVDATSTIASDFGRSCAAIYARAGLLGLTEGNAPPYTEWEIAQIRAGYASSVPVAQLGVLIGRPVCGIASVASRLGIAHANAPHDWSGPEQQRMLVLAEEGQRYRQIATVLAAEGFPTRTQVAVGQALRKLGYARGWGRPWIAEEDDLIRAAYASGASLTPLRARLGRSQHSIRWRADELGLQGTHVRPNGWRTEPPWTEDEIATLRRDYGKVPTSHLAASLGRKKGGVFNKAFTLGLVHGYHRPFNDDEKTAIRIAHDLGLSLTDLSAALDRDLAVVSKHAIRHLGLSFRERANKAPRGRRALRPNLTLAYILQLGDKRQEAARPAPTDIPASSPADCTRHHLIAGPGIPPMNTAVLHGMLAAGLLTNVGCGTTQLVLATQAG